MQQICAMSSWPSLEALLPCTLCILQPNTTPDLDAASTQPLYDYYFTTASNNTQPVSCERPFAADAAFVRCIRNVFACLPLNITMLLSVFATQHNSVAEFRRDVARE